MVKKIDTSKLKRVEVEYCPAIPKPGKRKKGTKSSLQKRKDNPNSKYWKTKADKAWGEHIHKSDMKCLIFPFTGDCKGNLEAHHLISRARVMTRHDIRNGVLLCSLHHKYSTECSPHTAPIQFSEFLREHYPERYQWVLDNQHKTGKPNYKEAYEWIISLDS